MRPGWPWNCLRSQKVNVTATGRGTSPVRHSRGTGRSVRRISSDSATRRRQMGQSSPFVSGISARRRPCSPRIPGLLYDPALRRILRRAHSLAEGFRPGAAGGDYRRLAGMRATGPRGLVSPGMKGVRRVAELIGDHIGYPAHVADAAQGLPQPAGESAPPCPRRLSYQRFVSRPGRLLPGLAPAKFSYIRCPTEQSSRRNQSGRSLPDLDCPMQDLACPPRWLRPPAADPAPHPRTPQARTPHAPPRRLARSTTAG
jgi:hypothetical protein